MSHLFPCDLSTSDENLGISPLEIMLPRRKKMQIKNVRYNRNTITYSGLLINKTEIISVPLHHM